MIDPSTLDQMSMYLLVLCCTSKTELLISRGRPHEELGHSAVFFEKWANQDPENAYFYDWPTPEEKAAYQKEQNELAAKIYKKQKRLVQINHWDGCDYVSEDTLEAIDTILKDGRLNEILGAT